MTALRLAAWIGWTWPVLMLIAVLFAQPVVGAAAVAALGCWLYAAKRAPRV